MGYSHLDHSHVVERNDGSESIFPCSVKTIPCHFSEATTEELGEWVNYCLAHASIFFKDARKIFPQWLEDYRKDKEVDQRARIDENVRNAWTNMNDYPDATLEMPRVLPGINWEKIQTDEEERKQIQEDGDAIVEAFARSGMTREQIQKAISEGFHEAPTEVLPRVKASFNAMLERNGIEGSWDDQEKSKMGLKNFNNEPYEPVSDEVLEARNRFAASITNRPVILADDEDCVKTEPEVIPGDNQADYLATAKRCVREVVDGRYPLNPIPHYDVYVVWFCKTLQNWKALVATTLADGMYYEVTRNGNQNETYVDIYHKIGQSIIYD